MTTDISPALLCSVGAGVRGCRAGGGGARSGGEAHAGAGGHRGATGGAVAWRGRWRWWRPWGASTTPRWRISSRALCAGTSGSPCTRWRSCSGSPPSAETVASGDAQSRLHPLAWRSRSTTPSSSGSPISTPFCSADVPCSAAYITEFGFVGIPFMAGCGFAIIIVLLLMARYHRATPSPETPV